MIAAPALPPDRDGFGVTYEELRRRVLTGAAFGGGSGLVVFLREGLAAGMARGAGGAAPVASAGHPGAAPRVANEIHTAVVRVLVSVALGHLKEPGR